MIFDGTKNFRAKNSTQVSHFHMPPMPLLQHLSLLSQLLSIEFLTSCDTSYQYHKRKLDE